MAAAKPASVASSKGDYVITKLDDLINWARRVRRKHVGMFAGIVGLI